MLDMPSCFNPPLRLFARSAAIRLLLPTCGTLRASSVPAGKTETKQVAPGDNSGSKATCQTPQFSFETWEGGRNQDSGGWPRVLVLSSTSTPARAFQVQVCLPAPGDTTHLETPQDHAWSFTNAYDNTADSAKHAPQECYTVNTAGNLLNIPDVSSSGAVAGEVRVSFGEKEFGALIASSGTILVGYETDDPTCKVAWDQASLRVFERNTVKILAGTLESVNQAGGFTNSGEAAVRFHSRFSTLLTGDADFWYDGIGSSSSSTSSTPAPSKASQTSQTYNPFSASKGIFRSDLTLGYYLLGRGVDAVDLSVVGGGGFTSNRMPGATAADPNAPVTVQTAPRVFAGLRVIMPSLTAKGVALSKAHSRLQLSLAHDNSWRFTSSTGEVNKPNRVVAEGDFDFYEAGKTNKTNVLVTTHLRWDAPADFNGGASDLRISILLAVNIFDL